MSKETIDAIRQAEEQAGVVCRVAEEKAGEMRAKVEAEGKAHCEEVRRATEAEYAEKLRQIRERAEALQEKRRAEAEKEAAALTASAAEHMEEAVKLIVWGIVEKCQ